MAKGDYIKVTLEIGGQLIEKTVSVEQNGGKLDPETSREGNLKITVLNRNAKETGKRFRFAGAAIRSVEEFLSEE